MGVWKLQLFASSEMSKRLITSMNSKKMSVSGYGGFGQKRGSKNVFFFFLTPTKPIS